MKITIYNHTILVSLANMILAGLEGGIFLSDGVGFGTHQYNHTGLGLLLIDDAHNGFYASSHLFRSVFVVIGAYPEYHNLEPMEGEGEEKELFILLIAWVKGNN